MNMRALLRFGPLLAGVWCAPAHAASPVGLYGGTGLTAAQALGSSKGATAVQPADLQNAVAGLATATALNTETARAEKQEAAIQATPGPAGASAYAVAVANGYTGTQAQWLASLVGAPGAAGSTTLPADFGPYLLTAAGGKGVVGRSMASHAGDYINATDYGASMNGSTDDGAAYNAARIEAGVGGIIHVNAGGFNATSYNSTAGGSDVRLWEMSGNTYATGGPTGVPVNQIGNDEVESFFNGGKFMGKNNGQGDSSPTLRLDGYYEPTATTNAFSGTNSVLSVNATVRSPGTSPLYMTSNIWAGLFQISDYSIGVSQQVAVASLAQHPVDALKDGLGRRAELWASNFAVQSYDGAPSSLDGSLVTGEQDTYGGEDDEDTSGNNRIDQHLVAGKSYPTDHEYRVKYGILLGTCDDAHMGQDANGNAQYQPGCRWARPFSTNGAWDTAAFDASQGRAYAITYPTSVAQSSPGTTLTLAIDGGVRLGEIVSGAGIPANDYVTGVTRETYTDFSVQGAAPTAPGTVTLAIAPPAVIPAGTALTFSTYAPAFQMAAGQRFCFDVNTAGQPLGKQCARYNVATGQTEWRDAFLDATPFLAFGKTGVVVNTGLTINSGMSVTGTSVFNTEADFGAVNGVFTDPEPNISRAVKISGNGLAVSGGIYGDTLTLTNEATFAARGSFADPNPGVARDIKAGQNGIAWSGGAYGDQIQVLGRVVTTISPAANSTTALVPTQCDTTLRDTGTGAHTLAIPTGMALGCTVKVIQAGAGKITFAAVSGSGEQPEELSTGTPAYATTGQFAVATVNIDSTSTFLLGGQVQ